MLNQKQSINHDKSTKIVKQRLFSNQHLKISHRGAAFKDLLALRCSLRKESMDLCLLANVMFFSIQKCSLCCLKFIKNRPIGSACKKRHSLCAATASASNSIRQAALASRRYVSRPCPTTFSKLRQ